MSFLSALFGDPSSKFLREVKPIVEKINALESSVSALSDVELRHKTIEFKERLLETKGETLDDLLPEAFAVVREAARRVLGQRHYDVQLVGGIMLHRGHIAEMKTGEGKTLTATLAVYLNALAGRGVHVVTVNDYLSARDAAWMGRLYRALGMSVGCIQHEAAFVFDPEYERAPVSDSADPSIAVFKIEHEFLRPVTRKEAYDADITYGTNNEFGFDYLRDNMVTDLHHMVQVRDFYNRESLNPKPQTLNPNKCQWFNYAIVDEVDSILIDEARTPLIISAPARESNELYYKFAEIARQLREGEDYTVDEKLKTTLLTPDGITAIERLAGLTNLYAPEAMRYLHHAENAVRAKALFLRDREYVVKSEKEGGELEVIIVDEFTGRMMYGRRYSEGLHQAIEAKEGVAVRKESETLGTITFQNYFRLYQKLSGMTGTAATESEEFHKIYGLDVVTIPPNRPMIRADGSDRVYATESAKYNAIVKEVQERQAKGQPILIGTVSVEKNERMHELLQRAGVTHEILNAKNHEREAAIIAQAGRLGQVTLATNMAGRGVDIILGGNPPETAVIDTVKDAGGLHVIGTERHESRRIDNQLRGRAGRQGDPGSSQFYVSLEDDLMRIFGSDRAKNLLQKLGLPEDVPVEHSLVNRSIATAQDKVESHNFDIRKHLLEYDDVLNRHRDTIYRKRRELLEIAAGHRAGALRDEVMSMVTKTIEKIVLMHTFDSEEKQWDTDKVLSDLRALYPAAPDMRERLQDVEKFAGDAAHDAAVRTRALEVIDLDVGRAYDALEAQVAQAIPHDPNGIAPMRIVELQMLLRTIDTFWIEHLTAMDDLRQGIGLRGYGQKDPLIEYKREGYRMFHELLTAIEQQIAASIFKVSVGVELAESGAVAQVTPAAAKLGRNDPCFCGAVKADGSAIKYKKCHGA